MIVEISSAEAHAARPARGRPALPARPRPSRRHRAAWRHWVRYALRAHRKPLKIWRRMGGPSCGTCCAPRSPASPTSRLEALCNPDRRTLRSIPGTGSSHTRDRERNPMPSTPTRRRSCPRNRLVTDCPDTRQPPPFRTCAGRHLPTPASPRRPPTETGATHRSPGPNSRPPPTRPPPAAACRPTAQTHRPRGSTRAPPDATGRLERRGRACESTTRCRRGADTSVRRRPTPPATRGQRPIHQAGLLIASVVHELEKCASS